MTGLDVFTFLVMFVLLTAVAILIKVLGALPGNIARSRSHPQAKQNGVGDKITIILFYH